MKKNYKKYILNFIILSTLANPVFAGVDYDAGMRAYNSGDYKFAKTLFQKAMQVNYQDVNARYMYCQILVKEKNYNEAKAQYKKIIEIAPTSQAASYSKAGLQKIDEYQNRLASENAAKQNITSNNTANTQERKTISQNAQPAKSAISTEPDYVKNAYRGGVKYLRPMGMTRVFIPNDSNFSQLMKQAYGEWQAALGSKVMFGFAGNQTDASDVVVFAKSGSQGGIHQGGNCNYKFDGTTLVGSTITINAYDKDGKPLPKDYIYHVMLHEIGHSIGIMGHSTNPDDVMAQGATKVIHHLSSRDKNTGRLLYQNYGKQPTVEDVRKAKTEELTDIAKRIPNDPSSLIDLGDEAMAAGKYMDAVDFYKKAEHLRADTDICFRMVKAYKALNDDDNVASYYRKILTIDKGNKIALNNLLATYQNQARYVDGKKVLDDFVVANPHMVNDKDIKNYLNIFSEQNVRAIEQRKKIFMRTN